MFELLSPPVPAELDDFYKTLLSVSGVLFGIAFAAMLFVLQSGFTSFKYSRRMFLGLYLHFGRQLLFSLAYLTAAPFVVLYFPKSGDWSSWLYVVYFVFFFSATLDYAKEEGYIHTLNSSKFVPKRYGRVRSYFRYIRNRGLLRNLFFLLPIFCFFTYPYLISIYENSSLRLSEAGVFYSCIVPFFYTLYKVTKFVPEFFRYTDMELSLNSHDQKIEISEDEKTAIRNENVALKEYLVAHRLEGFEQSSPLSFLDGDLTVQLLQKRDSRESWFNIHVNINNSTPDLIRNEVLNYAHRLLGYLNNSKVEINTFVLSFHVKIADQSSRNIFIRASRGELEKMFSNGRNDPEDILKLKNHLFDELFRI